MPSLMTQPAGKAVTRLLRQQLAAAASACARLPDGSDDDALHDFRVALRRLHTLWRAYGGDLAPPLPAKSARRIKKLLGRTGAARDVQVHRDWLVAQQGMLALDDRRACAALQQLLDARLTVEFTPLRANLPRRFTRLARRLRADLKVGPGSAPFGALALAGLARSASDYQQRLQQVAAHGSMGDIHQARIAGKRLRYLFEPLAGELPQGRVLVRALAGWQDLLGGIHDLELLGDWLAECAADHARKRLQMVLAAPAPRVHQGPDRMAGLLTTLAQAVAARRRELLRQLRGRLASGAAGRLTGQLTRAFAGP